MRRAPRLCQADRMHARTPRQPPRWYVISLRPRGQHDQMRRAARRLGGGCIAVSPWALYSLTHFGALFATDNAGIAAFAAATTGMIVGSLLKPRNPDQTAS